MNAFTRRFVERLREATGAGGDPSRFAASWAVGVGIGLSPFLGAHTLLALALALLLRLNKVDVLLGTLVSNPWTLSVYFPLATALGALLTGTALTIPSLPPPAELADPFLWRQQAQTLWPLVLSWLVGAGVLAPMGAGLTFALVRRLARRRAVHR